MWKSMIALTASAVAFSGAFAGISAEGAKTRSAHNSNEIVHVMGSTDYLTHSEDIFERSDLDGSGYLDVDEFAGLQVVKRELAHLNGFIRVTIAGEQKILLLKDKRNTTTIQIQSPEDRVRIDAVARQVFYGQAGDDQRMVADEYLALSRDIFDSADRNGDGFVAGAEVRALGVRDAAITLAVS
ncbi:MAG: hypothetical protein AAFY32_01205 [Pseudomonadota bacterium]